MLIMEAQEIPVSTELDIAKAIQLGELTSPQQYENIWLFDVRVTGTGVSFRPSLNEFVYRPQDIFLSDKFLERCNGLPLIFIHPGESLLNTEEYRNRAIGIVILPYIKGDEVWGIAKVYDEDAAFMMQTTHKSTSPGVMFKDPGSTETIEIDGKKLLIEGDPSLLDHLAVCEVGVWDKGGEPRGINNNGEVSMTDEQKTEQAPAWFDSFASEMKSRMDAVESKLCDSKDSEDKEESEAKEERKDAEEGKKEETEAEAKSEERKDAQEGAKEYADSVFAKENAALKAQIEALNARVQSVVKPRTHEEVDQLCAIQARADSIGQMLGEKIPAAYHGETPRDYRIRVLEKFKKHSDQFKVTKLDSIADEATLDLVEKQIYADAESAAKKSAETSAGTLIPVVKADSAGRPITTYYGDPITWMGSYMDGAAICKFNVNNHAQTH